MLVVYWTWMEAATRPAEKLASGRLTFILRASASSCAVSTQPGHLISVRMQEREKSVGWWAADFGVSLLGFAL